MREYLQFFRTLKESLPDFVAGFDLVAHEDDGKPLIDFAPALLQMRLDLPDVRYFFHAGETSKSLEPLVQILSIIFNLFFIFLLSIYSAFFGSTVVCAPPPSQLRRTNNAE